jgi:hypothetical protein
MNKIEFLKLWFNNLGYANKAAVQSIISIQFEDEESSGAFKKIPWTVFVEKGKFHAIIEGNTVVLDGDVNQPFAVMDDKYSFPGDFHPMLKGQPIDSTFGLMLFNIVLWWEPFMGKVDYVNQFFTKKIIEGHINRLMVDNPKEGETIPDDKASVDDCLKFTENCYYLEGLGSFFVKPGGVDALSISPAVLKRKDELFSKLRAEGKINDPVAFTAAVEELVQMDREEMLKGESKNFFINDKFINTARKRMFIAFGIEQDEETGEWIALPRSLDEGLDPEQVVVQTNAAVAGAYSRSMATGEGGSQVKETLRLVGRGKVEGVDCGTPRTEEMTLVKENAFSWVGGYYMKGKEAVLITPEDAEKLIGKPILMRVPQFCMTPEGNYCKICLGEGLAKFASRLSAEVVRVPTEFMLQRMKAHHQAGRKRTKLNLATAIK